MQPLVCGDVDKAGGSYCSGGSEPYTPCLSNADCAGSGTCLKACSGGSAPGWLCSSNADCVGGGTCAYPQAITSTDALKAQIIACAGGYDDLADVYPNNAPDGAVTDCSLPTGDTQAILQAAVSHTSFPICGIDDEPWW
jgi:hypothetical protein